MKLIQFEDGRYAIQRSFFGYKTYFDFKDPRHWWSTNSEYFERDCKIRSKDEAYRRFNFLQGNEKSMTVLEESPSLLKKMVIKIAGWV